MKKQIFSVVKYVLLLGVGLVLLYFAFKGQDMSDIFEQLKHANYYWIILSLAVMMIAHIARAIRWNMLIEPLGKTPSATNTTAAVMVGYLANLAFPRMGEVARCTALKKTDDVPVQQSIGTVVAERLLDFFTMILVIIVSLFIQYQAISELFREKVGIPMSRNFANNGWAYLFVISTFVILLLVAYIVYRKRKHVWAEYVFYQKIKGIIKDLKEGFTSVIRMKNIWKFLLWSVVIWGGYFLSSYLCFFSIESTSNLGPAAGIYILAISSIAMAAPVQGGIGTYHLFISQGLILYGIGEHDGLIFATIVHSSQTLMILVVGTLAIFYIIAHSAKKAKVLDLLKGEE